jgi:MFS family permease
MRQGKDPSAIQKWRLYLIVFISTFGRIIPGHLGDRYGVFNVMIVFTVISGILSLCLWLPAKGNASVIVFAALYGVASGTSLTIIAALVAQISDVRELGLRTGALYAVASFGALIGSPIGGAIVTHEHGGFSGLKIFTGVTFLVGAVFTILSRQSQIGLVLKKKI